MTPSVREVFNSALRYIQHSKHARYTFTDDEGAEILKLCLEDFDNGDLAVFKNVDPNRFVYAIETILRDRLAPYEL